eukprot:6185599-Pleurochrysis_carterae.AAC.1
MGGAPNRELARRAQRDRAARQLEAKRGVKTQRQWIGGTVHHAMLSVDSTTELKCDASYVDASRRGGARAKPSSCLHECNWFLRQIHRNEFETTSGRLCISQIFARSSGCIVRSSCPTVIAS